MVLAILLFVAVLLIAIGLITRLVLKNLQKQGEEILKTRFKAEETLEKDLTANFFGIRSLGTGQIRGNGLLVLTRDQLWFQRYGAQEPIRIPTEQIQKVSSVRSHLGKTVGKELLSIEFKNNSSQADAAAWLVSDLEGWKNNLELLIPSHPKASS